MRPVSLQVTVGALTVQTVAVVGAVRFTTYWLGAGPPAGCGPRDLDRGAAGRGGGGGRGGAEAGAGGGAAAAAAGHPRGGGRGRAERDERDEHTTRRAAPRGLACGRGRGAGRASRRGLRRASTTDADQRQAGDERAGADERRGPGVRAGEREAAVAAGPRAGWAPTGAPVAVKLRGKVAPWQASGAEGSMCMRIGIVASPWAGRPRRPSTRRPRGSRPCTPGSHRRRGRPRCGPRAGSRRGCGRSPAPRRRRPGRGPCSWSSA